MADFRDHPTLVRAGEDLDLAVGFHPYLAADMPGACRNLHLWNYRAPGGSVDFVEAMSGVEQILHFDPAGIYPLMDFATRDRYRQSGARGRYRTRRMQAPH